MQQPMMMQQPMLGGGLAMMQMQQHPVVTPRTAPN
jgi:hypothetical protein